MYKDKKEESHNPYFNRWFSAIQAVVNDNKTELLVTILILIDGFLQWANRLPDGLNLSMSQSLF